MCVVKVVDGTYANLSRIIRPVQTIQLHEKQNHDVVFKSIFMELYSAQNIVMTLPNNASYGR